VVYLNAGTYNLSSNILINNKSNVTLRGAGADKTTLVFSGGGSCSGLGTDICVQSGDGNWYGGPTNSASWTGGYSKGTTQITLSNTANLKAGSVLILDQVNDSSDTGNIFVCEASGTCSQEGGAGAERSNRSQQQMVSVTAVSGNTVTISPGLYMPNWRSSQSPGAWWATSIISGVGIENLAINNTNSSGNSGVVFVNARDSWVKGIKSITPNRNHVWVFESNHITVRDNYFYGTQNSAQQSYGVEPYISSDLLVENNIFQHVAAPITVNGSSSGSVFGYNYSTDDYYTDYAGGPSSSWMSAANWLHSAGIDNDLFEGNQGNGFIGDSIHGTHHFVTLFRNQYTGSEPSKSAAMIAVELESYSRYFNVIGNVLGTSGTTGSYQGGDKSVYTLGYGLQNGGSGSPANDSLTASTLMRWGNYDTVNNTVRWVASEVPSGIGSYANSVPASQALPASFYQSSKPSWWGSMPWPAVGPDVTGGSSNAGHVYAIPAQTCFTSTSKDSSGLLVFNADKCYTGTSGGSSPTLAPPSNVTVTVQ
jgi:hypothetical protein